MGDKWKRLNREIEECRACPRLVEYRERIAAEKRRAFRDWSYWGKPVPSLTARKKDLLILGLAPAAHGANRTGRMFTGDRSGDFLFDTLFRFGFCTQPGSRRRGDGLRLVDSHISAALHCAPPGNKPLPAELERCRAFLRRELLLLKNTPVVVILGAIALSAYLTARKELGWFVPRPRPRLEHGLLYRLGDTALITSYHPSQQNTQTGRLTREMFDQVFAQARLCIGGEAGPA